jgi:UDP-N-acetylmuramoylalanine--D-glutamate ligase
MALDLHGLRVAVIGMARSGIGAAKLVTRLGGRALISDMKSHDALSSALVELEGTEIEIETGSHNRVASETFDLIVLSPGVVPTAELEQGWRARGIPVWSEIELASRACPNPWIGVTGSNGKTTTVHLITDMLQKAGLDAVMAGNVGTAWSGFLPAPEQRIFVVEVSSFQLETSPTLHPKVAVLLNLFENHLDRHGTMDVYAGLKVRLFQNQTKSDCAVLNGDDEWVRQVEQNVPGRIVRFGQRPEFNFWATPENLMYRTNGHSEILLPRKELPLIGHHNAVNACAAAAAVFAFGVSLDAIRAALREVKAVEHRIEYIRERNGIAFYNDSKSTNMVATLTALNAFERNVILLFGGRPKKESFAPLADRISKPVKQIVVFGEAVPKVRSELAPGLPVVEAATIDAALNTALEFAKSGDTILLSPGCTSFDQYNNFEERGRAFKSLVNKL